MLPLPASADTVEPIVSLDPACAPVKNDLLESADGTRSRVLAITPDDVVWTLNLTVSHCWPQRCSYEALCHAIKNKEFTIGSSKVDAQPAFHSQRAEARQKSAWEIIEPLVNDSAILDANTRGAMVRHRAEETGKSKTTLNRYLQMFWRGGQSMCSLIPDFASIGAAQRSGTHGRGRRPKGGRYKIYQMNAEIDTPQIVDAIEKHYLKHEVPTLADTFVKLLRERYSYLDGDGASFLKPHGERPTYRQFCSVFKQTFSYETVLRRKKGDRDFERDHNQSITGALFEALCVGHIYEIDATIADVWLVAKDNRARIIGKPTLYLIYDRFSRLCVGFYAGLERPGWEAAMQAILSIAEDKAAFCNKHGVPYDPADWPAQGMFPQKFLGDRDEMLSHNSSRICDGMECTVANTRALSPQNKGTVECGFKLIHASIAADTPGYDPPRNAKRRRGKHYDVDASLTLDEFVALIVAAIIKHNRSQMPHYDMSPAMILRGCPLIPRGIWADDLRNGAGALSRYSEDYLRLQLLPRATATVCREGVCFGGCYYTCDELQKRGWFIKA